jgi:hypothetical protein
MLSKTEIETLKKAKAVLKKYAGKYILSKEEKKELENAYADIKKIQDSCRHFYTKPYTGLNEVGKICEDCDLFIPTDMMGSKKSD